MSRLYIVTGANGHLGNVIVRMLRARHETVRALIITSDSPAMLNKLGVSVYKGDVRDPQTLAPLFDLEGTDYTPDDVVVIHAAAIISIQAKKEAMLSEVNIEGTKNMVALALAQGIGRFIHISSVHALPELPKDQVMTEIDHFDPDRVIGAYPKTKAIATQHVLDAVKRGLNAIVVHPSGIIGPHDYGKAHMTQMIQDYANGRLTVRINGAYDFVDVRDVAQGIIQATISGEIGACYLLSGHRITLTDLFELMRVSAGKKTRLCVLPHWFIRIMMPFVTLHYQLRKEVPIFTRYALYTLNSNAFYSHEKANRDLLYQPRPMSDTIEDTIDFLIGQHRIKNLKTIAFFKKKRASF